MCIRDRFTTPVVYLYLDRAHFWYMRKKQERAARKAGAPVQPGVESK